MIKVRHNKRKFFLMGLMAFLLVSVPLTISYILSSGSFDQRSRAVSEIGVDLVPKEGNIPEEGFDIDLIVDTHGERISGVDVTLRYSGEVDYRGFFQGEIENCTVKDVQKVENEINLQCFIDPDSPTYQGSGDVFATANFRAIGKGPVEIEAIGVFFYVRDARGEVRFLGGRGDYTADSQSAEEEVGMGLSPSSGILPDEGLNIDLVIDTHDEEIDGVSLTVEYSGPVEYISFQPGEIEGCIIQETGKTANSVNLSCSLDSTQEPYKGSGDVFATVLFKPTGQGNVEIQITNLEFSVRDARETVDFSGGSGNYSTGEAGYPGEETPAEIPPPDSKAPPTAPAEDLPETSISSSTGILGGFVLVVISAIMFMHRGSSISESFSMRNKLSS